MTPQALPNHRQRNEIWRTVSDWLAWLTLAGALLYLIAHYGPGHGRDEVLYNADAMFIPVFFRDVMLRGTLAGWDLPTNPFFFPDMALFFPLLATTPNIRFATLLYGLLQLLLLSAGAIWLQRQLLGGNRLAQTFLLLTLTLCLLLIATGNQIVFPYALTSVHHMGVLVVMPFATVALLRALQPAHNSARRRALLLLFALTLLTALSETLFIIQFVLPALVAMLIGGKRNQHTWRYLFLVGGGLLSVTAAGQALRPLWVPLDKMLLYTNAEQTAISASWANFAAWVGALIRTDPLFVILWLLSLAALLGVLVRSMRRTSQANRPVALVTILFLTSMVTSLAAALLSGNFLDDFSTRYILPTVYLPLLSGLPLWLAMWLTREANGQEQRVLHAATSVPAALAIGYMLATAPPISFTTLATLTVYQDPFMACLQRETAQRQIRYGLADFWQATPITALAEGQLEVLAVGSDLAPVLWNNSRVRYQAPFEFVVINENASREWLIRKEVVLQKFGQPASTFACGSSDILVYDRPGDVPIRNWFTHHPDLVNLQHPGSEADLYGYTLPSHIGAVAVGLSQGASEQWDQDEGTLGHAPLKQLTAGSYVLRLDLFTDHDRAGTWEAGTWEVVAVTPTDRELLYSGAITQTGTGAITGRFDLKTTADVDVVVKYHGRGALYVDRIRIARVNPAQQAPFTFEEEPAHADAGGQGALHLVYPAAGSKLEGRVTDFVWQWTGAPLPPGESFEVRLWRQGESTHFGAHDAVASQASIRRIGDTYMLRLDLSGAYSIMQHGAGDYMWTVARVAIDPTYRDLQHEAAPFLLRVRP